MVAVMSFRRTGAAPAPMPCMFIRKNSNEAYSSVPIAADASALVRDVPHSLLIGSATLYLLIWIDPKEPSLGFVR
jgi:hypothetical protein